MPTLASPITNPVLIFGLAASIFLLAPLLAARFRIPGIIGLIVAGALVGPNGLNLLARDATFILFGSVGLLYLVFVAGIEIDLHGFNKYRNRALSFGAISYMLPQLVGAAVGLALGYPLLAAILLASMFGSHTLVAYPIASRLGIARLPAVTTAVGGTIVTDTTAFLVLAVIAAAVGGELDAAFWTRITTLLGLYIAFIFLVVPRIARWFFRKEVGGATGEYVFVLAVVFLGAYLAQVAGVQPIVGAFLVGLAMNRLIPDEGPLVNRIHFFGNAFFIPFFLVSVGMLVDVRALAASPRAWTVLIAMSVTVVTMKWIAARIGQRLFGYSRTEGWTMFGLTVPQAAATLAATLIGYEIGLFDDAILNGAIMMILVTCMIGPWAVEKYGRRLALGEEEWEYEPAEAPQRLLVPISNPATADELLELAIFTRAPGSKEPVFPLTVVPRGDGSSTAGRVAEAEQLLGHAVHFCAAAEIPVRAITRVDHNYADGITRAMEENRISSVIVGWDGRRSSRHRIFGSVLDQLLEQTNELVVVAKLGHPLNTTKRLVVVVPPGADHLPGFGGAVATLKLMADRLSARMHVMVIGGDTAAYARLWDTIKPKVPSTFEHVDRWGVLLQQLRARLDADDLVVVLSGRRGSVVWHPKLERLPAQLADLLPESFVVLYPTAHEATRRGELAGSAALAHRPRYGA